MSATTQYRLPNPGFPRVLVCTHDLLWFNVDAYEYADLIDRLINTCQFIEDPPHFTSEVQILENGQVLIWKDSIALQDGYDLHVEDRVLFDASGSMAYRLFTYVFVRPPDQIVFRFDTHGEHQKVDGPCHVHAVADEEEDVVEFPECEGIDFSYVMRCVKNHYLGRPQDWENDE